ncbi:MAG: helix-turn-helix transcriptional regulator [Bacilli bacterium]|nr:helix-turn-helix transcriptional regulator [Bacilli bacterium]
MNKINQTELGEKIGLSKSVTSKYMNGTRKPSLDFALRIKRAFKVSLDWLCEESSE